MIVVEVHSGSPYDAMLLHFAQKHKLLFQTAEWIDNYPKENLQRCAILNKNNELIGCFLYYRFKKLFFNCVISAPFTPNIDLFFINPAESIVGKNSFVKELLAIVADYFSSLRADYVSINLPDRITDTQPFIWKGYLSRNRYSYLIDLSKSKEEIWDGLSTEKRKSVNKAIKDELLIQETTDYKLVHSLILQSLERNNVAKNLDILNKLLFSFSKPSNSFAFVAYHNSNAIGASYCVYNGERSVYLFGGFDSENKHHGAGVSCMWHSILKAKELNLKYFDFEGSMNADIERYFREFGGELKPYVCVEKIKPLMRTVLAVKSNKPY